MVCPGNCIEHGQEPRGKRNNEDIIFIIRTRLKMHAEFLFISSRCSLFKICKKYVEKRKQGRCSADYAFRAGYDILRHIANGWMK